MAADTDFGDAFKANFRRRIKQNLAVDQPTSSRRASPSPSRDRADEATKYGHLYSRENRANILNVLSVVGDAITPNQDIVIWPEISLQDAEFLGSGATMEVFAVDLPDLPGHGQATKPTRVAVKRVERKYEPFRNTQIPLEQDNLYRDERDLFYAKVEEMTQEIRIMARVR